MKQIFAHCIILFLVAFSCEKAAAQTAQGIKSVTEISLDGKDKETTRSFKSYDETGNLIEQKEFDDDGKLKDHVKYEYNSGGQKVKEIHFTADGKPAEITTYEYDIKGNRIAKTETDGSGKVKSRKKYVYEFY